QRRRRGICSHSCHRRRRRWLRGKRGKHRGIPMRTFFIILLVIVILILGRMSLYSVDATEYAYVTQLGQHLATHDGGAGEGPGLHVGWPWPIQSVTRLDRRLQFFDLPGPELLTHDPQSNTIGFGVIVQTYVCWRIASADAVDRFIKSMGTA